MRPGHRFAILSAFLAGFAAIAVALVLTFTTDRLTPDAAKAVTLRARAAIESGAATYLGDDLACGVQLLGVDPPGATRASQVTTAYVWVLCATLDGPTESSLPVAVHFTTPPTAEVPGDGSLNEPDKKRIFPVRLWPAVIDGPATVDTLDAEMNRRREELTPP